MGPGRGQDVTSGRLGAAGQRGGGTVGRLCVRRGLANNGGGRRVCHGAPATSAPVGPKVAAATGGERATWSRARRGTCGSGWNRPARQPERCSDNLLEVIDVVAGLALPHRFLSRPPGGRRGPRAGRCASTWSPTATGSSTSA